MPETIELPAYLILLGAILVAVGGFWATSRQKKADAEATRQRHAAQEADLRVEQLTRKILELQTGGGSRGYVSMKRGNGYIGGPVVVVDGEHGLRHVKAEVYDKELFKISLFQDQSDTAYKDARKRARIAVLEEDFLRSGTHALKVIQWKDPQQRELREILWRVETMTGESSGSIYVWCNDCGYDYSTRGTWNGKTIEGVKQQAVTRDSIDWKTNRVFASIDVSDAKTWDLEIEDR